MPENIANADLDTLKEHLKIDQYPELPEVSLAIISYIELLLLRINNLEKRMLQEAKVKNKSILDKTFNEFTLQDKKLFITSWRILELQGNYAYARDLLLGNFKSLNEHDFSEIEMEFCAIIGNSSTKIAACFTIPLKEVIHEHFGLSPKEANELLHILATELL